MRKTKIAIVDPIGNHGGMNFYNEGMTFGLEHAEMDVYLFSNYRSKYTLRSFPFFEKMWGRRLVGKVIDFYLGIFKVLKICLLENIKIVMLHNFRTTPRLLSVIMLFKMFGRKITLINHDVSSFYGKESSLIKILVHRLSTFIIVHNHFSSQVLLNSIPNIKSKVNIIPHGNYLLFDDPIDKFVTLKGFTVLFFGQIKEVKGLDILIKAFYAFRKEVPEANLIIAGKVWKEDFTKYQRLINKLELNDSIELNIRYIEDDEIRTFFKRSDYIALPYREIYQSGVLLHSMSLGCPVIVSDLEPFTEVVSEGFNGYIFNKNEPESLTKALLKAYQNKDSVELLRQNCLATMKADFDWSRIGLQYKKLYKHVA